MSEQENINITRKLFDALNSHDVKASSQYLADTVQSLGTGITTPLNKENSQQYVQHFIDAFPDLRFNIKQVIAQGDWVAVTYEAKGKHSAPLTTMTGDTIPTTGRTATVAGATILQFRNDKVIRQELYWDMVALLMQLGIVTDMAQLSRPMR